MTLVFQWRALARVGVVRRGTLGAPSRAACARALEARELRPITISLDLPATLREALRRGPGRLAVADAFEYMADLLTLGVPQARVLEDAAQGTRDRALAAALQAAAARIRRGERLADALAATRVFSASAVSAIIAAEQTGMLPGAFQEVAARTREEAELIAGIRKATAYPAFVLAVGCVVGAFITFVVLPRITLALEGLTTLPPLTRVLIAAGANAGWIGLTLGLGLLGAGGGAVGWYRASPVAFWVAVWRIPLVGPALHEGLLARYVGNLAAFLRNGFPLLEALDRARHGLGNAALHQAVNEVRVRVRAGTGLAQALEHPTFPSLIRTVAARGEETGHTDRYLGDLSRLLSRRMVSRVGRLTTWVERLLIFAVAGFILFLAVAFLLPIYGNLQGLSPYR